MGNSKTDKKVGDIMIAEGNNAITKSWLNKTVEWEEWSNVLLTHRRTPETMEQYDGYSKKDKQKAKDGKGFIGAFCENSSRTNETIKSRSLIALDLDSCDCSVYEKLSKIKFKCVVASTHSHRKEKPKLRLIIPLKHEISIDEYSYLSMLLVDKFGLWKEIDISCFKPSQFMYYPSCSKDAVPYAEKKEGDYINLDKSLKNFSTENLKKLSDKIAFEKGSKTGTKPQNIVKKNNNNTISSGKDSGKILKDNGKKAWGSQGAFNRTHTVSQAIDLYLSDFYEKGKGNSYTWKPGEGVNGLKILDNDELCISYHGTDPANDGHQYNPFDLVCLHLFNGDNIATVKWCETLEVVKKDPKKSKEVKEWKKKKELEKQEEKPWTDTSKVQIPSGWVCKYDSLYRIVIVEKEGGEIEQKEVYVGEMIYITKKGFDLDNKYSFVFNIDGKEKIVPFEYLMTKSKIISALSCYEITINDLNAKHYVSYISDFSKTNRSTLPTFKTRHQFGWDGDTFIAYDKKSVLSQNLKTMVKTSGDFETWKNAMIELRKNNDFRFMFNLYVVSPFIQKLGMRNMIVHHHGFTRTGKTALAYACLSIWGNPSELEIKYDSTLNAMEDKAFRLNGIPLYMDEGRAIKHKSFSDVAYSLSNGKGKDRCNKDGTLKDEKRWSGLIFTSAEMQLIEDNDMEGVGSRTMEVDLNPFKNEETASKVYRFVAKHHGFGEKFIEAIKSIDFANTNFRLEYDKANLPTHHSLVELAILGDYISNIVLLGNACIEESKQVFSNTKHLKKILDLDNTDQMFQFLIQKIIENKSNILELTQYTPNRIMGKYSSGKVYIMDNLVKEWLASSGWNYNAVKKRLVDLKLVDYNRVRIGGNRAYTFVFDYVHKEFEQEQETARKAFE